MVLRVIGSREPPLNEMAVVFEQALQALSRYAETAGKMA
jgi:hypothetical protein